MKKVLIFSMIFCGFVFASSAQTAADKPVTPAPTGTEIQKPAEVQNNDAQPAQAAAGATVVKKECAGHGSANCAKSGEGKACCKAKAGASPAGSTATASDKQTATGVDKKKAAGCSGEHKECCKKKAETKSGS